MFDKRHAMLSIMQGFLKSSPFAVSILSFWMFCSPTGVVGDEGVAGASRSTPYSGVTTCTNGSQHECSETSPFVLEVKKVLSYPEQQHVMVPIFLCNVDSVGGWTVLVEYDTAGGTVVGVELCDSVFLDDPEHHGWHYAPWAADPELRPEYLNCVLDVDGHEDWVRVTGIMNMPWPQLCVPAVPPRQQQLLFCFRYDVSTSWIGDDVTFDFMTRTCQDNVLTNSGGYTTWGPDTASALDWTCPQRPDSLKVISLVGGCGIGLWRVVGDLNCNGIAYEIGDAVVFISYLVYGESALCLGGCQGIPNCEQVQTLASDINEDGYYWNIADLVMLLNIINERGCVAKTSGSLDSVQIDVSGTVGGWTVATSSNSSIGGALLIFRYPENMFIATEPGERLKNMDIASRAMNGELRVLVYSKESNSVGAGTGDLFTVFVKENGIYSEERRDCLTLVDADFSDAQGRLLVVEGAARHGDGIGNEPHVSDIFALRQNYPNPCDQSTAISYQLAARGKVSLGIYDACGRLVRTLVEEEQGQGAYIVGWNVKDDSGKELPSGTYFCKLERGEYTATKKLLVLR